jgi:hypothetical protein
MRGTVWRAAVAAVLLSAAACTGGPATGGGPPPAETPSPEVSAAAPDGVLYYKNSIPSPIELPFAAYYTAANAVFIALDEEYVPLAREALFAQEEFTARCMKDAGFTYYPQTDIGQHEERQFYEITGNELGLPWLPETLDEAERFGYGMSPPEEMYPDEYANKVDESEIQESVKKNKEYFQNLSDSAKTEYSLAFNGSEGEYVEGVTPKEEMSCSWRAGELYPLPQYPDASFLAPMDLIDQIPGIATVGPIDDLKDVIHPEGLYADSRLVELNSRWVDCVKANRNDGIWNLDGIENPSDMIMAARSTAPDGSLIDARFDGKVVALAEVPLENRALTGSQVEIDMAVADFKCRAETDYVNTFAAILLDVENKFIANHKDELDKMMAAVEEVLAR